MRRNKYDIDLLILQLLLGDLALFDAILRNTAIEMLMGVWNLLIELIYFDALLPGQIIQIVFDAVIEKAPVEVGLRMSEDDEILLAGKFWLSVPVSHCWFN